MRTILVIAQHPSLSEAVRAALDPERYRVIHKLDVNDAEALIERGIVHGVVFDAESADVQNVWGIEKIRRRLPKTALLIYTAQSPWEWEEEAYLQGAAHVLVKPVKPRLLNALVERLVSPPPSTTAPQPRASALTPGLDLPRQREQGAAACTTLEALKDFSVILTHSLRAEPMLKQFLLMLREILAVNRAAIFVRQPESPTGVQGPRLRSASAIGLAPGLLEHFQLSFESGIGGHLYQHGRVLRRETPEAQDGEMQKEFALLGTQVAIPILDRESIVGVALFDGRITGEPLTNPELGLIFHLLEELGLALRNIWLHDQLAANHEMLASILRQLNSACIVVDRDLNIVHANRSARSLFARPGHRGGDLDFSDLPQSLGGKIYQVLKSGAGITPFKFTPPEKPEDLYYITIVPFQKEKAAPPGSVLLVAEDRSQSEHVQRLEVEAAGLRVVKSMADRIAHEVGNALVPLSTHHQLLGDRYRDPEFRGSLEAALGDGIRRISRLINQMRFLARDELPAKQALPLAPLVEEAFQEAQKHQTTRSSRLQLDNAKQTVVVDGDRSALKHALAEILLNAIQANPAEAKVDVRAALNSDANGSGQVEIEVWDNGTGFSAEAAQRAAEPFFTTRNVGLGLGLTVCRKIIELHQGRLAFQTPQPGQPGIVKITLPSSPSLGTRSDFVQKNNWAKGSSSSTKPSGAQSEKIS